MMHKILPSKIQGTISLPPSELQSIHALAVAALIPSACRISNIALSQNVLSYISYLQALGAQVQLQQNEAIVQNTIDFHRSSTFNVGGNAKVLPFLVSIAGLVHEPVCIEGNIAFPTLAPLLNAMEELGVRVSQTETSLTIQGPLRGGQSTVNSITMWQLRSLLVALPYAAGASKISVPKVHQRNCMGTSVAWLDCLGIQYTQEDFSAIQVPGNQEYIPFDYLVGGDSTIASFFFCAAAVTGSVITCDNVRLPSRKKTSNVLTILENLGCEIRIQYDEFYSQHVAVRGPRKLRGGSFSLDAMSSACIVALIAAACHAEKDTTFFGINHAAHSLRGILKIMQVECKKIGVLIEITEDTVTIMPLSPLQGADLDCHQDPRVAMALTIVALGTDSASTLRGAEFADNTFFAFLETLNNVQV